MNWDMDDLEAILERLERNEKVAEKFFEVEVTVLSVLNFKDLFERLLTEIREKFAIPYVWITLISEGELAPLIPKLSESEVVRQRLSLVARETLLGLVGSGTEPILVNKDLSPFYKLFPDHEKYLVRSMALAPIALNGEAVGTLNLGDTSPDRYVPGMDTTLLKRLAVKVSVCLSNVVAHEKIKLSSSRDEMTGLLNAHAMEQILAREFQRAIRYNSTLSVILLEITPGLSPEAKAEHDGDVAKGLIGKMVKDLSGLIRVTDVMGVYDNDRLIIVLPSTTKGKAQKLLERLCTYVSDNPIDTGEDTYELVLRGGIGCTKDPGVIDSKTLVRRAADLLLRQVR